MSLSFRTRIKQLISKGEEHYTRFEDKQRVRLLNVTLYLAIGLIFPYIFTQSLIVERYSETVLSLITLSAIIVIYFLNTNGRNQTAAITFFLFLITQSYVVVFVVDVQIAAPFFDIIFGSAAIFFIKNKKIKIPIAIYSFSSFIFLNYYQLIKYPPNLPSYAVVILLLFGLYVIMSLFESESSRYQKILESKNTELNQQNDTIKSQAEQLVRLEKESFEKELAIKQKDFDQVLVNNRMQLKIRKNMLTQLERASSESDNTKTLKSMIFELKALVDTQKKLQFTEENIRAINTNFFNRLNSEFPNLTKKETELCSYIKLGLSTKEIAHLLSTTENTIYVTKNRLRSKLNLSTNDEVNQFIMNV